MSRRLLSWTLGSVVLALACSSLVGCANSGWVMNSSGAAYYRRGDYAMARNEFARAVYDNPANVDYRYNLAMAAAQTGDTAYAEQVLQYNLSLDPSHQPTYHAYAQMLSDQGRSGEAMAALQSWAGSQPYNPQAQVEMAWLQQKTGDTASAQQSLQHALQLKPNDPAALAQLGNLYQQQGQLPAAQQAYQQSLARNWNQPGVRGQIVQIDNQLKTPAALQNRVQPMPVNAATPPTMMAAMPVQTRSMPVAMMPTNNVVRSYSAPQTMNPQVTQYFGSPAGTAPRAVPAPVNFATGTVARNSATVVSVPHMPQPMAQPQYAYPTTVNAQPVNNGYTVIPQHHPAVNQVAYQTQAVPGVATNITPNPAPQQQQVMAAQPTYVPQGTVTQVWVPQQIVVPSQQVPQQVVPQQAAAPQQWTAPSSMTAVPTTAWNNIPNLPGVFTPAPNAQPMPQPQMPAQSIPAALQPAMVQPVGYTPPQQMQAVVPTGPTASVTPSQLVPVSAMVPVEPTIVSPTPATVVTRLSASGVDGGAMLPSPQSSLVQVSRVPR